MNKQKLLKELNSEKIVLEDKKTEEKSVEIIKEEKTISIFYIIIPLILLFFSGLLFLTAISSDNEDKSSLKSGDIYLESMLIKEKERERYEKMHLETNLLLMKRKILLQAKKEKEEAEKLELLEQFKDNAFKDSNISIQSIDNETVIFFNGEKVTANGEILLDKLKLQIEKNNNVENK